MYESMSQNLAIPVCDTVPQFFNQLRVFNLSLLKVFWKELYKDIIQLRINHYGNQVLATKRGRIYSPLSFLPAVIVNLGCLNPSQNIDCDQLEETISVFL